MEQKHLRAIKSFAKRSGRITASQRKALDESSKKYCLPYAEHTLDLSKVFSKHQPTVIEIGFGNGESLITMAKNNPNINYLGVEVHTAGVGHCLIGIELSEIKNLILIEHDAVEVLNNMIVNNSIHGFQVFFPDPWHKTRHQKRRLIQPDFVDLLSNKLTTEGFIHCATDWEHYSKQMLEVLSNNESIDNQYRTFAPRPDSRPLTKFERRGERLEHGNWDLIFKKITT
ncbi:MAG: tRNA (guanine-N7-)-methyltransferase [Francisellaceae bacterium]|jgi:tRNA (guanine-N7-)-methyltransferase